MDLNVQNFILTLLANALYLTGLALIIPLSIIIVFSEFVIAGSIIRLLVTAVLLVSAGAGLVYFATKSAKKTMRSLGTTTLVPAALSVVLAFINERLVFATISFYVSDFQKVEPFITRYLEQRVPHSLYLTVGYLVVGLLLLWFSKKH